MIMKTDGETLIYELSDEALETTVSMEQVPTVLNASYCLTCWGEEGGEEQAFPAVTTFDSSSADVPRSLFSSEQAKRAMLESSENGDRLKSHYASDLVQTGDTSLDEFYCYVSDDALEAAANVRDIGGNNTLGLTLVMPLAPAPCC
jgi:hypothetical protein